MPGEVSVVRVASRVSPSGGNDTNTMAISAPAGEKPAPCAEATTNLPSTRRKDVPNAGFCTATWLQLVPSSGAIDTLKEETRPMLQGRQVQSCEWLGYSCRACCTITLRGDMITLDAHIEDGGAV